MNASDALAAASMGLLIGSFVGLCMVADMRNVQALPARHEARTAVHTYRVHAYDTLDIGEIKIVASRPKSKPQAKAQWVCNPPRALSGGAMQVTPHDGASNYNATHPTGGNVTECHWVKS